MPPRRFPPGLRRAAAAFFRLGRRFLQRRRPLGRNAGAVGLDCGELLFRLGFGRACVGILLVDLGAARIDQAQHRPVQEAMQQPDEDREIDRLQREGGPVEMHAHPAYGLAKSSSRATTRQ